MKMFIYRKYNLLLKLLTSHFIKTKGDFFSMKMFVYSKYNILHKSPTKVAGLCLFTLTKGGVFFQHSLVFCVVKVDFYNYEVPELVRVSQIFTC